MSLIGLLNFVGCGFSLLICPEKVVCCGLEDVDVECAVHGHGSCHCDGEDDVDVEEPAIMKHLFLY